MLEADVQAYRAELDRVRRLLEGQISLYFGVEIDYLGDEWGPASLMFAQGSFDYAIGSVHFIPAQDGTLVDIDGRFEHFSRRMAAHFDNDIRYVVETFYKQSHKMLDAGGFDILGHFDKISQNASYFQPGIERLPWYEKIIDEYIDHIIAAGVIVEINTKAREQHGRFFPHERYWRRLLDANVDLCVNSDAHFAHRVNASRDDAFELLDKIIRDG